MKEKETRYFQSEVKQLLNLMINSLYSNKEIFLRELISNASDAIDKLKFRSLSNPNIYNNDHDLRIRVSFNKEKRLIVINDNGIGMNKNEVIDNLGTIAKSGTKEFLESLHFNKIKDNNLIGQFGVGFYSAFIVAKRVTVKTRSVDSDITHGVFWSSNGDGEYSVATINKEERGTEITLDLRDSEDEFLNYWKIQSIIKKYSDHISVPIEMHKDFLDKKQDTKVNNIVWEQINKVQALWVRNKNDITNKEYKDFYKYISNDSNDPIIWSHNKVEGKQEYISLIYIPSQSSWDMWNRQYKHGLKLYVKRIFIMDNAEQLIPNYLRFVKGILDTNNLSLNISREILQDSTTIKYLKQSLTKRILNMIEKLSNDNNQYQIFWQQFGLILKEGLSEDPNNIEILSKLLRFASTKNSSNTQNVKLQDYINRMLPEQDKIYYITADNYKSAYNSPHLELLKNKNIEVILLFDRIDEWMMNHLTSFNGKQFQSISKSDFNIEKLINVIDKENEIEEKFLSILNKTKLYLGDKIKDVKFTNRLSDTPAVVTTESSDITTQMAKILTITGQNVPKIKYIFELNAKHILLKYIANIKDNDVFEKWIDIIFNQALLIECGSLEDHNKFIKDINNMFTSFIIKDNIIY